MLSERITNRRTAKPKVARNTRRKVMTDEDFISVDYVFSLLPNDFWVESPCYAEASTPPVLRLEAAPKVHDQGLGLSHPVYGFCYWESDDVQEPKGPDNGVCDY